MNTKLFTFFKTVLFCSFFILSSDIFAQVYTPELDKYKNMDAEELWNIREELVALDGPLFQVLDKAKNTDEIRTRTVYLTRYEHIINKIKGLELGGEYSSVYDVPGFRQKLMALDEVEEEIRAKYTEVFNLDVIYEVLAQYAPDEDLNLDEKLIKTVAKIFKSADLSDTEIEVLLGRPKLFYFVIYRANRSVADGEYNEDLFIAADLLRIMLFKKENYNRIHELSEKYDIKRLNKYSRSFVPEFDKNISSSSDLVSRTSSTVAIDVASTKVSRNIVNRTLRSLRLIK